MSASRTAFLHSWTHETEEEARKEILGAVGDIDDIEVFGNQVLVGVYVRPVVTRSGLIISGETGREDFWQGKVGLLLKLGEAAWKRDEDLVAVAGDPPVVGQWVYSDSSACMQISLKCKGGHISRERLESTGWDDDGWPCRLIHCRYILGTVAKPGVLV